MSRVSLNRRLEAVLHAAERIDPFAAKVHRLPPALRERYDAWRADCARLIDEAEREGGPGASYAALIDDALVLPDPPRAVAEALGMSGLPVLTEQNVAAIYSEMIGG